MLASAADQCLPPIKTEDDESESARRWDCRFGNPARRYVLAGRENLRKRTRQRITVKREQVTVGVMIVVVVGARLMFGGWYAIFMRIGLIAFLCDGFCGSGCQMRKIDKELKAGNQNERAEKGD